MYKDKKIKLVEEFKAFISKGNVVDMAVGVVVGGAFGKIVTSLVSDLIMPLVGLITGGGSLKDMFVVLGDRTGFDPAKYTTPALAAEAGYATLNYGNFIQTVLDFLIIALAIFLVIKLMATAKSKLIHEKSRSPLPRQQKLPVLLHRNSDRCGQMPALHERPARRGKRGIRYILKGLPG